MINNFFDTAEKHPKFDNKNYYPMVAMTKKMMKNCNVLIVANGLKILKTISLGLRKNFVIEAK